MSDRQQVVGRNAKLAADLRYPTAGDHSQTLPVVDSGPGYAKALAQRDDAAGHGNEIVDGHGSHGRIFRRDLSIGFVGASDTTPALFYQNGEVTNLKAIGRRVRELRLAEGIGQEELAAIVGVSRSTIAGIETGGDRGGIETMIAIADHYKVPMDWLLRRNLPPSAPPVGKLVYRPDQVAILSWWDGLTFDEMKVAVKILSIPITVAPDRKSVGA